MRPVGCVLYPRLVRRNPSRFCHLALWLLAHASLAEASPAPAFIHSVQETLKVPEREDHSPFLGKQTSGAPVVVWVATSPDTNQAGRFDEVAVSARGAGGWGTPQIVGGPAAAIFTPEVVCDTDLGRWIVWAEHDGTDSQIRVRRDSEAQSWQFSFGDPAQPDLEPSICADTSGGVLVVWQGWRSGNYEILFRHGDENGFSSEQVISESGNSDREPEIVWGDGQAWIVWSSYRNPAYNLICRRYNGTTLTSPVALTTSYRARNLHPQIAWDGVNHVLWYVMMWVNQAWLGINQHEFPGLYDTGSPRVRAYNGTTIFVPSGLDSNDRYPLAPMEALGYQRFDFSGTPNPDRYGEGLGVVALPGGRVEVIHKQDGMLTELGAQNFYWSVTGTRYGGGTWSAPGDFLELRSGFAGEDPGLVVAGDSLWVAWSADKRSPPIQFGMGNPNLFGHDANVVVRGVPCETSSAGPPALLSRGSAVAPAAAVVPSRTPFTINDGGVAKTLYWGDNHRHSLGVSWDAYSDPAYKQTIFYSLDWLGHDFISPSDHAERFSKAMWAFVARASMIYDIPGRLRVFPGYERAMRAGLGGGDQNQMYRDPAQFTEASAAYPENNNWHVMYAAQQGIDVLSVPHTPSQCGAIAKWHQLAGGNPAVLAPPLRMVEVYQAARDSFEYPGCPHETAFCTVSPDSGWVSLALALGMRVGLLAASDHTIVAGYIGVLAPSPSRDDIWTALHERHAFGASKNGRMNVDFRVGGALMGSEITTGASPTISIYVKANSPLAFIEVNKNGNPSWFSASSAASETTITFTDPDVNIPGTTSYYYLRTRDSTTHLTWAGPVWVTHSSPVDAGEIAASPVSQEFAITARPNPTAGEPRFAVRGIAPSGGTVRIYDLAGRLLRELALAAGATSQTVEWNRRDGDGRQVAAGVYYAVAQSGGQLRSEKLVILR